MRKVAWFIYFIMSSVGMSSPMVRFRNWGDDYRAIVYLNNDPISMFCDMSDFEWRQFPLLSGENAVTVKFSSSARRADIRFSCGLVVDRQYTDSVTFSSRLDANEMTSSGFFDWSFDVPKSPEFDLIDVSMKASLEEQLNRFFSDTEKDPIDTFMKRDDVIFPGWLNPIDFDYTLRSNFSDCEYLFGRHFVLVTPVLSDAKFDKTKTILYAISKRGIELKFLYIVCCRINGLWHFVNPLGSYYPFTEGGMSHSRPLGDME